MNSRLIFIGVLALALGRGWAADATVAPAAPAAAVKPATVPAKPAVAAALGAAPRKESALAATASFDSFRVVSDRNIFDPNRTGRRDRSSEDRAPRSDMIALVGTMDSDKGLRAFFEGSDRAYRRALAVGAAVDKFKVVQITPDAVDLERDGKTISMRVGQQLRRPDGGDWNLVGADVVAREAAQAASEAAGKVDPMAPVAIPAGASDILRKMMEARNKSLKQ